MAPDPDDGSPAPDPARPHPGRPVHDHATAPGGYGERVLPEDASAEDARRHAAQLEASHSGPADSQAMAGGGGPRPTSGSPRRGPGDGQPAAGQPGGGQPGGGQPGDGQPGDGQPGDGQPGGGDGPADGPSGDEADRAAAPGSPSR